MTQTVSANGICVERCPFDVDIMAKMREAAEVFEEQAA